VVGLVDGANQIVNKYHYTPWGEPASVTETVVQPLRYMAREYDEVAGLYQVRARYGDQRRDQAWINEGIRYYREGCGR
jgi:hypothetical protein